MHITCSNLSYYYEKRPILEDISISFNTNEKITCIGSSGAGKTTFLKLLAGLIQPSTGTITENGLPLSFPRKDFSVMWQEHALFPWKTALQNVALPLLAKNIAKKKAYEKASLLLNAVGLASKYQAKPYELSGGEKQRVALARALSSSPQFLLLDEPFSALDELTRGDLQTLLLEQTENHIGYFLITHSLEEALYLGEYIYILSKGHINTISNPFFKKNIHTLSAEEYIQYKEQYKTLKHYLRATNKKEGAHVY